MIQVTIVGNVTSDPQVGVTPKGDTRASFSVAVNERIKNDDGTWGDGDPTFYRVMAWRQTADGVAETIRKGNRVIVVGKFNPKEYKASDGTNKTSLDITAEEVGVSTRWNAKRAVQIMAADSSSDDPPF
jgi:single-strand DNA-binding protein